MANSLYNSAQAAFARGQISWETDSFVVLLMRSGYVYSAAHTTRADLTSSAIAGELVLPATAVVDGALDADDVVFAAVPSGAAIASVVIAKGTIGDNADPLVFYIDQGVGLPLIPDGSDVTLVWDPGANRIARL